MFFKVAVIGKSGSGKSSFNNAFRGLKPRDKGAAPVGVIETTMKVEEYPHPHYPNLILCDLPGVGTDTFPKETYLQKVNVDEYDFFIILTATRFDANDTWLVDQMSKRNKKCYMVRAKIDEDVKNEKENGKTEQQTIDSIRANLQAKNKLQTKIFLVNNKNTAQYDFGKLIAQILEDMPSKEKKDAFALSMSPITPEVEKAKKAVLLKYIG